MPELDNQRVIFEALGQLVQVGTLSAIILKRPGKLHQHRAEFACFRERIDAFAKSLLIFPGRLAAFVRERSEEFCSEDEIRIVLDAFQPRARGGWCWRTIEAAVNFGGVEILCDQREGVELRTSAFRIDTAAPIGV